MDHELQKKIIITLSFYDVLDYPLTGFEIYKYLSDLPLEERQGESDENYTLLSVMKELESDQFRKLVTQKNGFYFLHDREDIAESVETRINRDKISAPKLKKARFIAKILTYVPFVRMIALTSNLAMKNARRSGDLDFMIVLEESRIWTGRFLVTGLLHIFGLRRYNGKIKDRACLNFYLTTKSLEIAFQDLFFAHEYYFMLVLYGRDIYKKFQLENSYWIKRYKINFELNELESAYAVSDTKTSIFIKRIGEKVFSFLNLEKKLGKWQTKRIVSKEKSIYKKLSEEELSTDKRIIQFDDNRLVFWPKRAGELDLFLERISRLKRIKS